MTNPLYLEYLESFKEKLKADKFKVDSIEKYVSLVLRLFKYINARSIPLENVTEKNILSFLNQNKELSPRTWNNYMSYVNLFFIFLDDKKGIENPCRLIDRKPTERRFYKKSLSTMAIKELYKFFEKEVERVETSSNKKLSLAAAKRDLAFLGILISTGNKINQVSKIKLSDVTVQQMNGESLPTIIFYPKGKKHYKLIPEFVYESILSYQKEANVEKPDSYLFKSFRANNDKNQPVSYAAMRSRINKGFVKIGVKDIKIDRYLITPHSLRHSLGEILQEKYGTRYVTEYYNYASMFNGELYRTKAAESKKNRPDIEEFYGIS